MRILPLTLISLIACTPAIVCAAEEKATEISIHADGKVFLGTQEVDDKQLVSALSGLEPQQKVIGVLIVYAEGAKMEWVKKVIAECRKCGINQYSVQTWAHIHTQ